MNTNAGTKSAASEQAYNQIRQDIISGVLEEHERLTEQALAERIGLSRTPVREAIKRLIHEGFIENESGYSTRVASFSVDEAEQVFQLRTMLEGYAIRR
ncbi:MAG: DNA-binding GntR family transcriptional regulator, partial [Flavobacteriaceae bacterium]